MILSYILTLAVGFALGYFAADYTYDGEEYISLTPKGRQTLLDSINNSVNVEDIANQKSDSEN
tara:strand:- start:35 stop:223 length:189 start_codon:yes stop_codon:yes gene_type:complete